MSQTRQLAAIMFTDIAGYTALMGNDEQKALELLKANRLLQQALIHDFGGRWIKELGDGVLASFSNASDAVLCALAMQQACADVPGLRLRIGIHLGDVVFEDNDVFGDSVNIAARLQAMAPVGSIWISEPVYKSVANNRKVGTVLVGDENLKNVKEPVRVYAVKPVVPGMKSNMAKAPPPAGALPKSIAVLAFANISNDPGQEYFSDGMAEEIINSLHHLKDLKVASRTSSFQFKGMSVDLREVGEKLGVSTVLEGSVRKQGNRLRITAQLINAADGFHLWSQQFDRDLEDVFAIQEEIALAITDQLKVTLFEKEREKITRPPTLNTAAYEAYLQGRFHINQRGTSILTGLQFLRQAIAHDPGFALAYAGYADANILVAFYNFRPGREVMGEVRGAAETAIKLDSALGEAYCALGSYYMLFEWNWKEVEKNLFMAMELNPHYAQSYSWYGMVFLGWLEGRFEDAEKMGRKAVDLVPFSAIDHADLCWTVYTAGKFEEALVLAKKAIELDVNSFLAHRLLGLSYLALQRHAEAIETFTYLVNFSNRHQHAVNSLIWAFCSSDRYEEAGALMEELKERASTEYIGGAYLALSAACLKDLDAAFQYLDQACEDRDPILIQLRYSPFAPSLLRTDPRFQEFLNRVGFPK